MTDSSQVTLFYTINSKLHDDLVVKLEFLCYHIQKITEKNGLRKSLAKYDQFDLHFKQYIKKFKINIPTIFE